MSDENLPMEDTHTEQYPMRDRYWCCAERIGDKHKRECPSAPTEDGPDWHGEE